MANLYLIQLVGVMLSIAGMIALTASAHWFGTRLSPAEKRRAGDEWNRRGDVYRLPINLETIASRLFFLGGIGILTRSKFNLRISYVSVTFFTAGSKVVPVVQIETDHGQLTIDDKQWSVVHGLWSN